eukprot:1023255-Pelagomonas_calceolata.AAC.5
MERSLTVQAHLFANAESGEQMIKSQLCHKETKIVGSCICSIKGQQQDVLAVPGALSSFTQMGCTASHSPYQSCSYAGIHLLRTSTEFKHAWLPS